MSLDLPLIFAALMGLAVLAYVVLDGYDLGVGMLMPAADARDAAPASSPTCCRRATGAS